MDTAHMQGLDEASGWFEGLWRVALILIILVTVWMMMWGASSGLAGPSAARLYGEVKGKTDQAIQIQLSDKVLPVSAEVAIRDEDGEVRLLEQVYVGTQVVLHLHKGQIVGVTLLSD